MGYKRIEDIAIEVGDGCVVESVGLRTIEDAYFSGDIVVKIPASDLFGQSHSQRYTWEITTKGDGYNLKPTLGSGFTEDAFTAKASVNAGLETVIALALAFLSESDEDGFISLSSDPQAEPYLGIPGLPEAQQEAEVYAK